MLSLLKTYNMVSLFFSLHAELACFDKPQHIILKQISGTLTTGA